MRLHYAEKFSGDAHSNFLIAPVFALHKKHFSFLSHYEIDASIGAAVSFFLNGVAFLSMRFSYVALKILP